MSESASPTSRASEPDDRPKVPERYRHLPIEVQRELEARGPIPGWIWFLLIVCAAAPLVIMLRKPRPPEALKKLGLMPEFSMTDEHGKPAGSDTLRGHVWVGDFIFTRCQASCPRLTGKMAELQRRLAERAKEKPRVGDVRLVSITVDPDYDTPSILADYAKKAGANPATWTFLSGKSDDLDRVVLQGFKLNYERKGTDARGILDIAHANHLVLVDHGGNIRGYYDALDPVRFDAVVAHAERLATEGDQ
jgi:protein SCO1/2